MYIPNFYWQYLSVYAYSQIDLLLTYWYVILSIILLTAYAIIHFDSTAHRISLGVSDTTSYADEAHLLTAIPPTASTRLNLYRPFMVRYVFIVLSCFIFIVFLYHGIQLGLSLAKVTLPDAPSTDERCVIALLILMGLLPSIPFFTNIDSKVLKYFYERASVPGDSIELARDIIRAQYKPPARTLQIVEADLKMRDTKRLAKKLSSGLQELSKSASLEAKVIKLRCLREQLFSTLGTDEYKPARSMLALDFQRIEQKTKILKDEVNSFLRMQEIEIKDALDDIDLYLEKEYHGAFRDYMIESRKILSSKCEELYELICVTISVLLIDTKRLSTRINVVLRSIGIETAVARVPEFDIDTIVRVSFFVFLFQACFNQLFAIANGVLGDPLSLSEATLLAVAFLNCLAYILAMGVSTGFSKVVHSKGTSEFKDVRVLCALLGYICTLPFNIIISMIVRGELVGLGNLWSNFWQHPLPPFIFAINQAILSYFTAWYVRDSLSSESALNINYYRAISQGMLQSIPFLLAYVYGATIIQQLSAIVLLGLLQALISGTLAGVLFQRWYRKPDHSIIEEPKHVGNADESREPYYTQRSA